MGYGYRGDVLGTVNIPTCEVTECDVAKPCSIFRHIITFIAIIYSNTKLPYFNSPTSLRVHKVKSGKIGKKYSSLIKSHQRPESRSNPTPLTSMIYASIEIYRDTLTRYLNRNNIGSIFRLVLGNSRMFGTWYKHYKLLVYTLFNKVGINL